VNPLYPRRTAVRLERAPLQETDPADDPALLTQLAGLEAQAALVAAQESLLLEQLSSTSRAGRTTNGSSTGCGEIPGLVQGGQWCAVLRDAKPGAEPREQPSFLEVRDLRWDARGERLAYCARDEAGWRVVAGEVQSAPHADVGPPVFSADGATLAFGRRDGDELGWRELDLR
jgi:hypothetical protein